MRDDLLQDRFERSLGHMNEELCWKTYRSIVEYRACSYDY